MTDLSRYADWTAWLTAAGRYRSGRALRLGRWLGRDRRVRRVVGPRRRRPLHAAARRPRSTTRWLATGARGLRPPRTSGSSRRTPGRTAGSASSTSRTGPGCSHEPTRHRRPARLRPGRPALAPRRTPARDADRAPRPRRADRPRGGGRLRGAGGGRLDQVRQRRATDEWLVNRAIARGHVAEAVDFYLRFAPGRRRPAAPGRALPVAPRLRAALPARGPAARRGRPDRGARAREPPRPRSRSCRSAATRGWTTCLDPLTPPWSAPAADGGSRSRLVAALARGAGGGAAAPRTRRPRSRAGRTAGA